MFKIADSHNDFLTNQNCDLKRLNTEFKKNNVALCNTILYSDNNSNFSIAKAYELKNKLKKYHNLEENSIYSFENLEFLKTDKELDELIKFNPFSCSLTWNYSNQFAGGTFGYDGLSKSGQDLVRVLNDNNILIDTAHINRRSFWDVVKISNRPILNSHTCFNLKEHRRNIDIEQVNAIIETNGFIGITFIGKFLIYDRPFSCYEIFKNIDAIVQEFGKKNIGIGSDFFGTEDLPYDLKSYNDFENLYQIFKDHNYSQSDIDDIFYNNFANFVKNNTI